VVGLLGCILPALPGPPLNYLGMWCLQWAWHPFANTTLIVLGIVTAIVLVLDYAIPVWSAKIFGATKQGIYGSVIGMVAGIVLTPIGMVMGMLLGAFLGDVMGGKSPFAAVRSGFGTFVGTFVGIAIKLIVSTVMATMVFYRISLAVWGQLTE
jgi:uncharacterized protein YqgC (DUF456 family)